MAHPITITLVLAFLSSVAYAQQDYMFFYLRWPGGKCAKVGKCCFPDTFSWKNDFTVQYLARNFVSSGCSETLFDANAIKPLLSDLNKYWPSFDCIDDANQLMWEQLWTDNGVCTGLQITEYFAKSLQLRKKANLLNVLARNGIKPSDSNTYRRVDVVGAISTALGVSANSTVLHCGDEKLGRIIDVRFCVDITATRFITCPNPPEKFYCPETVKLDVLPNSAVGEVIENLIEMVVSQ